MSKEVTVKSDLIVVLLLAISLISNVAQYRHAHPNVKHQGPVTVIFTTGDKNRSVYFQRPNREVFEMFFDNPPPLYPGMKFSDLLYTDDNSYMQHFVGLTQ